MSSPKSSGTLLGRLPLNRKRKRLPKCRDTFENESNVESSSDREEEEEEEKFLRMAVKIQTPKRATTTLKTTVRKQKVVALKRLQPYTLKIPVKILRTLMCTGH